MPRSSQDGYLINWDTTAQMVRKNKASLPGVEPHLAALEKAHDEVVTSLRQRDALLEATQAMTRQLQVALAEGCDAAVRLRSFIKSVLGIHSEQLVAYGIKPIRKRGRRQAAALAN
jgi:hypothetical protein